MLLPQMMILINWVCWPIYKLSLDSALTLVSHSFFRLTLFIGMLLVATVDDDCIHIMLDSTNNTKLLLWRIQERLFH